MVKETSDEKKIDIKEKTIQEIIRQFHEIYSGMVYPQVKTGMIEHFVRKSLNIYETENFYDNPSIETTKKGLERCKNRMRTKSLKHHTHILDEDQFLIGFNKGWSECVDAMERRQIQWKRLKLP